MRRLLVHTCSFLCLGVCGPACCCMHTEARMCVHVWMLWEWWCPSGVVVQLGGFETPQGVWCSVAHYPCMVAVVQHKNCEVVCCSTGLACFPGFSGGVRVLRQLRGLMVMMLMSHHTNLGVCAGICSGPWCGCICCVACLCSSIYHLSMAPATSIRI